MPSRTLVFRRVAGEPPLPVPLPTDTTFASLAREPEPRATLFAPFDQALAPIAVAPCAYAKVSWPRTVEPSLVAQANWPRPVPWSPELGSASCKERGCQ